MAIYARKKEFPLISLTFRVKFITDVNPTIFLRKWPYIFFTLRSCYFSVIPWADCDDNTNKYSIHFLVVLSFHLELNISMIYDIFYLLFPCYFIFYNVLMSLLRAHFFSFRTCGLTYVCCVCALECSVQISPGGK